MTRVRADKVRSQGWTRAWARVNLGRACVVLAVASQAAGLGGCGTVSGDDTINAFVDPGRYNIYTCGDIAEATQKLQLRQTELEQLMGRSSQTSGGQFANAIAYNSEYVQTRAELKQLAQAKADKHCAVDSPFSSGRAVF